MDSAYAPLLERSDSETELFSQSIKLKKLERLQPPRREVKPQHGTTRLGTLMHILKGNVGTGLLALPLAVKNAGLLGGPLGLLFVSVLAIHCMHLLAENALILASRHKSTNIDYAGTLGLAVRHGSIRSLQPFHRMANRAVNLFIFITQFGFCCVYFVFMAENLVQVLEFFDVQNLPSERIMTLILAAPIFSLCLINSLDTLAPFSLLANLAVTASVGIIFFFCTSYLSVNPSTIPHLDMYASLATFPTAFGSAVFAFEGRDLKEKS